MKEATLRSTASRTQKKNFPYLRIYIQKEFFRSLQLEPGIWVVGRDQDVQIHVEGEHVSRKHFQLEYAGENKITLQDLSSSYGTHINGEKVSRAPVAHGDVIEIGEVRIIISHPAYSKPKVIPFPKIKTDPKIEIAKIQKRVQPATKPRTEKPSRIDQVIGFLILVLIAGGLALGVNEWMIRRIHVGTTAIAPVTPKPRRIVRRTPIVAPMGSVAPIVEQKQTQPTLTLKPDEKKNVVKAETMKEVSKQPVEGETLSSSLTKSLRGIEIGDIKTVESHNVKGNQIGSESNLASLKPLKTEPAQINVDIQMPKMETPMLATPGANAKPAREFNPKKYQAMLRDRIIGIEACYVRHVKEGTPGKVSVWFTIAMTGNVKATGVANSTLPNKALQDCMVNAISRTKFDPPPWDDFTVTYGFNFGVQKVRF